MSPIWTAGQQTESEEACQPNQNFSWKPTGKHPTRIIKGINFTNWAEGEPNCNEIYGHNSIQSCLALKMDGTYKYKWHALGCESKLGFICEFYV